MKEGRREIRIEVKVMNREEKRREKNKVKKWEEKKLKIDNLFP